jgi:hypothetical protein
VKTTRIAPGIYSLSPNGKEHWVEGINGPGVWLVHDKASGEYWPGYFTTKRAAVSVVSLIK